MKEEKERGLSLASEKTIGEEGRYWTGRNSTTGEENRERSRRRNVERSRADINYEDLQRQSDASLRKEASLGPHGGYPWFEENIFGPQVPEIGSKPWESFPDYAWILVVVFGLFAVVLWVAWFLL